MAEYRSNASRWLTAFSLATTMLVSATSAYAGGVNTTNSGTGSNYSIKGGTYENTAGGVTTFNNNGNITLHAGQTVRGVEVNSTGGLTGNGGNILIDAGNHTVRVDGNINVNAIMKNGMSTGNGGTVTVKAGTYYQNGNIYANGTNGGTILMNVGSATIGNNPVDGIMSRVEAKSTGNGNGGHITINATGAVNLGIASILDTTGHVVGGTAYDTNVISISGGLVNMQGIVSANHGQNAGDQGGKIDIKTVANQAKSVDHYDPGLNQNVADGTFTREEADALIKADKQLRLGTQDPVTGLYTGGLNGSIKVADTATLYADGANGTDGHLLYTRETSPNGCNECTDVFIQPTVAGNGGLISLNACKDVIIDGKVLAPGGRAGQYLYEAKGPIDEHEGGPQNGLNGGNGGTINITYRDNFIVGDKAKIRANGGNASDGQTATLPHYTGGKGGDGGNGGTVNLTWDSAQGATAPSAQALSHIGVYGGKAGRGGNADKCNNCFPHGENGAPGTPGKITKKDTTLSACPTGECTPTPPVTPPVVTPPTPTPTGRALYPREYPRLGEALPPGIGPVLSYNRSVYVARSPLPFVKKQVVPAPPVVKPVPVVRKPKPAQKKVPVRGYW